MILHLSKEITPMNKIVGLFNRAMKWLATIHEDSWHYRLMLDAKMSIPNRIWTYYCICIPWVLILWGFHSVEVVVAYFFGFSSNPEHKIFPDFYPYKTTKNGNRKLITPLEVVVCSFLGWFIVQIGFFVRDNQKIVIIGILSVCCGIVVVSMVVSPFYFFRQELGCWVKKQSKNLKKLGWACPPLVVVKKEAEE